MSESTPSRTPSGNGGGYTYEWPRPMVTVDAIVFRPAVAPNPQAAEWEVLLIERGRDPFAGSWALPGGFVDIDEDLEPAAHRELEEETGLSGIALEQLRTFGTPGRDPRGRSVTVAYVGTAPAGATVLAADDAAAARWWPLSALPDLAFDHDDVLAHGVRWLHRDR
jgi:8-oxo-dGTP diphosphatase